MILALGAVGLLGVACSRAPEGKPAVAKADAGIEATDCDAMAARVTALRLASVSDEARATMRAKVAANCAAKQPSLAVRQCVVRARTLAELDRCGAAPSGERFEPPAPAGE